MSRNPSAIIHALRVAGDEFQLGRVLAGVCSSSNEAARGFLGAVRAAAAQQPTIGHRAEALRLPERISCLPEQGLIRTGRGRTREQARVLGRADLFFAAKDLRLICELKIDSGYQPDQIRRYLNSGHYVVSIVRAPHDGKLGDDIDTQDRWLGEVAWNQIEPGLRALPLPSKDRQQWLDLLAVLNADGDFASVKPKRVTAADMRFVRTVAEGALLRLQRMRTFDAAHRELVRNLNIGSTSLGRSRAWATISDQDGEPYWWVGARDTRRRSPEIVVDWIPWEPPPRDQRQMHRRLQDQYQFSKMGSKGDTYYRSREVLTVDPGEDGAARATECAAQAFAATIEVGLLEYDARRHPAGPG